MRKLLVVLSLILLTGCLSKDDLAHTTSDVPSERFTITDWVMAGGNTLFAVCDSKTGVEYLVVNRYQNAVAVVESGTCE